MATTVTTKPASACDCPADEAPRNGIAEWVVTFLILFFGTSTIAQPFVIPTSSMHNTLFTGDHLIVDKLAYAPAGAFSKLSFSPMTMSSAATSSSSATPFLLQEDYVKRVIGIPGDHIKLIEQRRVSERQSVDRAIRHSLHRRQQPLPR